MDLATRIKTFPWARFLRFCVVGGSGVVVNYGVYLPLTRWFHLLAEWSQAISIAVSILSNFALNETWTFRDRRTGDAADASRRLGKFVLVSLAGAAIQWSVSMGLFRLVHLDDRLAVLAGIAVATGWNFALNLAWTWRRQRSATAPADAAGH